MIDIVEVKTKEDAKRFILFQNELYKDVPQYIPVILSDELANISEKDNPAYDYCNAIFYLALRNNKIVGRIGAIINHTSNEKWAQKRVRITRMDFIDDDEVVDALMSAVSIFATRNKMNEIVGPVGFCDLDKEGMLVDGFNERGLFITYYNYPYYVKQMERCGFVKDVDWIETRIYPECKFPERFEKTAKIIESELMLKVVKFKSSSEYKHYVKSIFELVDRAYSHLYGTVPLTARQANYYHKQFETIVNPNFFIIIEDKNNNLIAFALAGPGIEDALKATSGKLFPIGWLNILKAIKHPKTLDAFLIAIDADYQKKGIGVVLLYEFLNAVKDNNIEYIETGPMLETNKNVQSMWQMFKTEVGIRRRRSWKKTIE